MSEWKYIQKDQIVVEKDEVHILFESDDFGNRYIVLKIEDIKEALKLNKKKTNGKRTKNN